MVAGGKARVQCVVQIARSQKKALVVFPTGLTITARHPVRIRGHWRLASSLAQKQAFNPSGYVYNFVLERCHILLVDGIECATWGHGLEGKVVEHPYYGTQKVIQDIKTMPGWVDGLVQIEGCFKDVVGQVAQLKCFSTLGPRPSN